MYLFYPFLKFIGSFQHSAIRVSAVKPFSEIYSLNISLAGGAQLSLSEFRGRKILVVNTASSCGYTPQIESLKQLQQKFPSLVIIFFPSNDFKNQEPLSNSGILEFCRVNFGVSFPVAVKSVVLKTSDQNEVFYWLTNSNLNGWNDKAPRWNFTKYLINEEGNLVAVADASADPLNRKFVSLLK